MPYPVMTMAINTTKILNITACKSQHFLILHHIFIHSTIFREMPELVTAYITLTSSSMLINKQ